jgi:sugar lactone lactonase YvrE
VPGAAQAAIIATVDHVVWDRRFGDLVDGASLRQVGDGFGFPEGPLMLPDGYLVFSDIANDALVRFTRPGRTGIFRQPSGGANGNTLDPRGRLVTCEAGRRRVTLRNHRQWMVMRHAAEGVGDGMKVDMDGHGYVTGPGGVWVVAPDGTPLGILRLPVAATNVAFYGYDAKIVFVTAPPALFVVRLARPGISVLDRIR